MEKDCVEFKEYFEKVQALAYENARITFTHCPFPLFKETKEIEALHLGPICALLVTLASKVHRFLVVDFHFDAEIKEHVPLKHFQAILTVTYSIVKESVDKHHQQVLVRFPQLVSNQIDLKYDNDITFSFQQPDQLSTQSQTVLIAPSSSYTSMVTSIRSLMEASMTSLSNDLTFSFDSVCFGGSFDHYHIGHNMLVLPSTLMAKKSISIGVTSNEMLSKKNDPSLLQSCGYRIKHLHKVISLLGSKATEVTITRINDPVSFSGTKVDLQALLVTSETAKGGDYVNAIRKENNVPLLQLISLNVIGGGSSTDYSLKVSSTKIRNDMLLKLAADDVNRMHAVWKDLLLSLGIKEAFEEKIDFWWSVIRDHYLEPWRFYHTLKHVKQMLNEVKESEAKVASIEFLLAIWFHDAIYVPSRSDNEERSAELMKECLSDLLSDNTEIKVNVDTIETFIRETKHHLEEKVFDNEELKLLLDLDLSVFTLNEDEVKEYQESIRKEYFFVSDHQWVTERKDFLLKLKAKERMFHTERYKAMEDKAKKNIDSLIALLV